MNNRNPLIVSFAIVAAMLGASIWAVFLLAPGTPIPIHWDINGQPNGFARGPFALFMTPAMAALIALFFAAVPWIEPRRLNLIASTKFYHVAWIGTILLLAVVHGAALYAALHKGVMLGNIILGVVSLFIAVIGNYLGKTRSMFLGGVRTPWTLSSGYSWQRTHGVAGKMLLAAGVMGFVAAIALPPAPATHLFLTALGVTFTLSVVISFFFWLRDPERRKDDAAAQ